MLLGEEDVYPAPDTDFKKGIIRFLPINAIDLRLFTLLFWNIFISFKLRCHTGAYGNVTVGAVMCEEVPG